MIRKVSHGTHTKCALANQSGRVCNVDPLTQFRGGNETKTRGDLDGFDGKVHRTEKHAQQLRIVGVPM